MAQLDGTRAALNVEEAVLLPALSPSPGGKAACKSALQKAAAIDRKRVSNQVFLDDPAHAQPQAHTSSAPAAPRSRAALHHALRK